MRLRHHLSASLLAACCLFVSHASADVQGAQHFVEKEHGQIKRLVDSSAPADQVKQAIGKMVSYDELARRTFGKPCPISVPSCTNHWDQLTPAQQTEVTGLLRQLVEKNFQKNLSKTKNYEVTYRGAKEASETRVSKIRTEAKSKAEEKKREPPVQVDYMVLSNGDQHLTIDIITEGSSMTKNYYDQFHRMLTTPGQGYPYIVQRLKQKIATPDGK
ncbi:MAG: ABC transporter substrate-binding protein [Labilithrix sp.]|nr:ABC transporter substrate-binding protein [Labilithrix sp.]